MRIFGNCLPNEAELVNRSKRRSFYPQIAQISPVGTMSPIFFPSASSAISADNFRDQGRQLQFLSGQTSALMAKSSHFDVKESNE